MRWMILRVEMVEVGGRKHYLLIGLAHEEVKMMW